MLRTTLLLLCLGALSFSAPFQNGSFELNNSCGSGPGNFVTLSAGSTCMTGWTVDSGNVDYINGYWQGSDGTHSVDMNGSTTGGISQTFDTNAAHTYQVMFDMAGNYAGPPTIKTMQVTAPGYSNTFTFDVTGKSAGNMGYATHTFTFVSGNTGSSTLAFLSTSNQACCYGPVVDNVQISDLGRAVVAPEPGTVALLVPALGALALFRRRK